MVALEILANNFTKLNANRLLNIVYENKSFGEFVIDLNRFDQIFSEGIQTTGEPLTSTNSTPGKYSKFTETLNAGRSFSVGGVSKTKIEGGVYFLYDTGEFYNSFKFVNKGNGLFEIVANTMKPDGDLETEFGNLIGLTNENMGKVIDLIEEIIIPVVKEQIFKGV